MRLLRLFLIPAIFCVSLLLPTNLDTNFHKQSLCRTRQRSYHQRHTHRHRHIHSDNDKNSNTIEFDYSHIECKNAPAGAIILRKNVTPQYSILPYTHSKNINLNNDLDFYDFNIKHDINNKTTINNFSTSRYTSIKLSNKDIQPFSSEETIDIDRQQRVQKHDYPNNPFASPVGDAVVPLLSCLYIWSLYHRRSE